MGVVPKTKHMKTQQNTITTEKTQIMSAVLFSALSRLATWDGQNGPCFCSACDYKFGPDKHRHTSECDKGREALAIATGQYNSFVIAGHAWKN